MLIRCKRIGVLTLSPGVKDTAHTAESTGGGFKKLAFEGRIGKRPFGRNEDFQFTVRVEQTRPSSKIEKLS